MAHLPIDPVQPTSPSGQLIDPASLGPVCQPTLVGPHSSTAQSDLVDLASQSAHIDALTILVRPH
ncbi:hypothetical protein Pyn_01138 [Prunus yedoensis var. nudiflora]|uniref:Uncharacterized protein n=1 Tax=Prunus yedoensis var. nudiflora TaxID=2094558 RepID=A0A314Z092_PRUYE|nr:hypothetical protein Pyn_01138 [Prunus yedoensis var. nudiflora]